MSSLGVPQILVDQLTLSQPGGIDYAHQTILAPPDLQTSYGPEGCRAKVSFSNLGGDDNNRKFISLSVPTFPNTGNPQHPAALCLVV